jgi:hypothetical protein
MTAVKNRSVSIKASSKGGLGTSNLELTIKNLSRDSSFIKIPPGLHFKSAILANQDLMTVSEQLLALAPQAQLSVQLQGLCMQAGKYAPSRKGSYTLSGFADPDLKGLADLLYKYDPLTQHYGQMFVWAITDNRTMFDVSVDSSLVEAARSVIDYVTEKTGQDKVSVTIEARKSIKPKLEVFSKRSSLAFHNPLEQVASFHMYDADGNIMYTMYRDKKLGRGIRVHEFGMNDMVLAGSNPVYYFRVITKTGKILAEKQVNRTTEDVKIEPELLNFRFEYQLKAPVKEARLKVYLQDGTLLEEFKRYTNLQPGNYAIDMKFLHLYPANTTFVAKMESPDGLVHKEQLVIKKN